MKKMLQEFKTFALRGNVMDLAVGVIIGAAFQSIVKSLTDDIISPLLGLFGGGKIDFTDMVINVGSGIRYGAFLTAVLNFVIMALMVFLLVKGMNRLASIGRKPEAPKAPKAPATKACPFCCTEISIKATRCPHCTSELRE